MSLFQHENKCLVRYFGFHRHHHHHMFYVLENFTRVKDVMNALGTVNDGQFEKMLKASKALKIKLNRDEFPKSPVVVWKLQGILKGQMKISIHASEKQPSVFIFCTFFFQSLWLNLSSLLRAKLLRLRKLTSITIWLKRLCECFNFISEPSSKI